MRLLVAYLTIGYPVPKLFLELLKGVESAGADVIELGIPPRFAKYDGPLIRRSYEHVKRLDVDYWALLKEARSATKLPIVVLAYLEEFEKVFRDFVRRLVDIGVDSLLLPDLLIDYVDSYEKYLEMAKDVGITLFTSPSMPDKLIERVSPLSKLFLYYGIRPATGIPIPVDPVALVKRVRPLTKNKLVVGFGLSLNEVADVLKAGADGIAVGSAIIQAVDNGGVEAGEKLVKELRGVIDGV
uniref:tryptophan synthase n=1 Tax=Fervidicoccus fontis TaxID=683846 RepID=A0A7J3ZKZ5_9CREN